MKNRNSFFLSGFLVAFFFSGCVEVFRDDVPAESVFYLRSELKNDAPAQRLQKKLVVSPTKSSLLTASTKMFFLTDGQSLGSFQLARWADTPASRFSALLLDDLRSRFFPENIIRGSSVAVGGVLLDTDFQELVLVLGDGKAELRLLLSADLIELPRGKLFSSKKIDLRQKLENPGSAEMAQVASELLRKALVELEQWLGEQLTAQDGIS